MFCAIILLITATKSDIELCVGSGFLCDMMFELFI